MTRQTALVSAFFSLGTIVWSSVVLADGALAVGMPNGNPRNGFAYWAVVNESAAEARSQVLATCRRAKNPKTGEACRLIDSFRDQCVSVSFNGDSNTPSTAVGWAIAPSSESADRRSQAACEAMRGGSGRACSLYGASQCDGNAR